ncbi:MAG: P-type DNA transfer ATPase VirB11 [Pseudomonadota bacterium]|uniref:P-type DNA transfer ATPase VirB11 n=1 Tax=Phenylobacterium sp. TaxID=1871053 RepID=UPI0025E1485B|nr:P-type DNA transfer ATPase VirB11 [Phenylobacterium sp.]MBT9471323.1 P-type DNA transfer ATPase VirB11 [Phenylobacterium sp.]
MADASVLEHYLAPLTHLLASPGVTELVVNRPGEVGVETSGRWSWHNTPELSFEWLSTLATAAAGHTRQDIGADRPICSTVLPGGERCQIVIPPATPPGLVSLTVRKPSQARLGLDDLAHSGFFSAVASSDSVLQPNEEELLRLQAAGQWPAFFDLAVRARRNILISGATGSGKTTFAKSLIALIPLEERLLTIEDCRELIAPHRNLVHLLYSKDGQGVSKADVKALLESALRMRPDRILLQELRDGIAFFYLRNIASGHPGSITTIHADSAALAFEQLTLLVRESDGGRNLPRDDIHSLLRLLVDIVVQVRKTSDCFGVTEVYYEPLLKRRSPV